jgi:molybdopterin molybdotransferase
MQGRAESFPPTSQFPLRIQDTHQDSREEFLRVQCHTRPDGSKELVPYTQQGSAILRSIAWASGLARLAADTPVQDGDPVAYYELRQWLS